MSNVEYWLLGTVTGVVIFVVLCITRPKDSKIKHEEQLPEYVLCMDKNRDIVMKHIQEQFASLPSPADIFDALTRDGKFVYSKVIGQFFSILAVRVPGKIIIQISDHEAVCGRLCAYPLEHVRALLPYDVAPPTTQSEYLRYMDSLLAIGRDVGGIIDSHANSFLAELRIEAVKRNLTKDSSGSWSPFAHTLFGNIRPDGCLSTDMNVFAFSLLSEADNVPRLTSNDTGTEAWVNFNTGQDIWLTENRRYVEELLKTMFTDPTNIEIFSKHVKQVLRTREELIRKLDDAVPVSNVCLYGTTELSLLMCELDEINISQNAITFGLSTPIHDYIKNIFEPEMFYELVGRYLMTFLEAALSRENSPCEVTTAVMSNDTGLSHCPYLIIGTKYPAGYHYFLNYDKPEEK